jgi:hypothetical protein
MKEAPNSPYAKLVFRETFNSEQSVRNNGGVPTDVTFEKGIASFNGTTSYIKYNKNLNGVYSVRIKSKNLNPSSSCTYIDFRNSSGTGVGYLTGGNLNLSASSGTAYVNGVATNVVNASSSDIVITGITIKCFEIFLNTKYNLTNYLDSDTDLFEIYQGTLTASEVKNLYDNDWNKEFISSNLLLDYDSTNGYITDRAGKNTLTATDVSIKKTGSYYGAEFNGITSLIDTGSDFIGTKAITICGWVNSRGGGGGNVPRILDTGTMILLADFNNKYFSFTSNASNYGTSKVNSYLPNKPIFVSVTRTSTFVNFYVGDLNNAPVLSGNANQNAGAPITGTTNVIIGNRLTGMRCFDGNIPMLKVYEGILDLETITQIWSSTRGKVN